MVVAAPQFLFAQSVSVRSLAQYSAGDYIFTEQTESVSLSAGLSIYTSRFSISADVPFVYQSSPYVTYGLVTPTPTGGPRSDSVSTQRTSGRGKQDGDSDGVHGGGGGPTTIESGSTLSAFTSNSIRTGSAVLLSSGPVPVVLPDDTTAYNQFGISDPVFSLSATVLSGSSTTPSIRITGSIKAPVGSVEDGFSTGAVDYSAGLATFYMPSTSFLAASANYYINGDMEELVLDNTFGLSATIGRNWESGKYGLMASGFYSTSAIEGVDAPVSVSLGFAYSKNPLGVSVIVSGGLSESAPDYSVAIGISRNM